MEDQIDRSRPAPGVPGAIPNWSPSSKMGVGTAYNNVSRIWFTLGNGILNEIYHPRSDWASTRDMGFLVTDGQAFFSEEQCDTKSEVTYLAPGVPAYHLVNRCKEGRYQIEKDVICDPKRNVILQRVHFKPLTGKLSDYHLYALLMPHLNNQGRDNTAWVGDYKGIPMLFASYGSESLAMGCSAPWKHRSVGYVGVSDGWQDLAQHKKMTWEYSCAEHGNVALTAEIDLTACKGEFVLAIGLEARNLSAGHVVRASLQDGFDSALKLYISEWKSWQKALLFIDDADGNNRLNPYRVSTSVLQIHEDKDFHGGLIASLSTPWGFSHTEDYFGGYHIVWTRDLVEGVGGLIAAGAQHPVRRVLHYLQAIQETDGHWPQNMWVDGTPHSQGIQLDEVGFPVLLTEQAWRESLIGMVEIRRLWPMVRKAIRFIVQNGPATSQDRWETNAGFSPFTLAVEVSALLSAARLAEVVGENDLAVYLRETADLWNDNIERWTYITDTDLSHRFGVDGYYIWISPSDVIDSDSLRKSTIPVYHHPQEQLQRRTIDIVSPDALALVRFGLRAADDPRILNTLKVIDALLKVETPYGPAWHRYSHDGYGEHADGSAYDGMGIGRAWPLLTGERAHYELAAGREDQARQLLKTLENFAGEGGMLPEQVWDSQDIPEHNLYCGRPTGSAMPLVWTHAEHIKLRRSLRERRVFDMPPHPLQRYVVDKTHSPYALWRFNLKIRTITHGQILRIELDVPACVHWSIDEWTTTHDMNTRSSDLGIHLVDIPTQPLPQNARLKFTFYWLEAQRWENQNFEIALNKEG